MKSRKNCSSYPVPFCLALFALLWSELPAQAGPTQRAHQYMQRNNFGQVRRVTLTARNGRQVTRVFVPVTEGSVTDFLQTFGKEHGSAVVRVGGQRRPGNLQDPSNWRRYVYVKLALGPDKAYKSTDDWAGNAQGAPVSNNSEQVKQMMEMNHEGHFVVMQLGRRRIEYLERFLDTFHNTTNKQDNKLRYCQARGLDQEAVNGQGPNGLRSNCMWWFVHAETAENENIAQGFGVRRSSAPENLADKLVHQANENIRVIGVRVQDAQDFAQMSEVDLLGPAPLPERR
ncbi:MAG: hypothetical protein V1754_10390 [Pseudomonadota bacterium]